MPANHGMTDEELSMLTEEERAGLEDDDDDGDYDEGDEDDEHDDDTGADDSDDDGQGAGQPDDDGQGQGTPAAADEDNAYVPQQHAQGPNVEEINTQLTTLQQERAQLAEMFSDGEYTASEYQDKLDELDRQRDELRWQLRKGELVEDARRTQEANEWFSEVGRFLKENPDVQRNKLVLGNFDQCVREVTGDPANASLSNRRQLELAHAKWCEALGVPAKGKGKRGAPAPAPALAQRAPLPPNLSRIPAADLTETDDGQYKALDRLMDTDPIGFEKRLARMSEAEQDAYLSSR